MDRLGISMAGLVANVAANGIGGEELVTHVDEVAPVIKAHPDRFFGWVGINPLKGMETLRYIEYGIKDLGFKGVHVYPHWFGAPVNDRIYYPIYAKCAELGVPITLQVGTNTPRSGARCVGRPILLDDVAFHFPELKLIGLHIGVPWTHEMTMLARNYENVFIIADAHPPREWEKPLLDYITEKEHSNKDGSHKVMWGTDWPIQMQEQSLKEVDELGFPPEIRDRLLGENAIRILGLDL
jgi:predicted TIM-barrel fold metal-dependent hydrolase